VRDESTSGARDDLKPRFELGEHPFVGRRGSIGLGVDRGWCRHVRGREMSDLVSPLMNLGELADSDQVVWRGVENAQKLRTCFVEAAEFKEGAAECHSGREVCRVLCEARLTHPDGFFAVSRAPVLFGQLRKRNRRRILLDPASKILNPRVIRHASIMVRLAAGP
jgi:hypothetical protein